MRLPQRWGDSDTMAPWRVIPLVWPSEVVRSVDLVTRTGREGVLGVAILVGVGSVQWKGKEWKSGWIAARMWCAVIDDSFRYRGSRTETGFRGSSGSIGIQCERPGPREVFEEPTSLIGAEAKTRTG